MAYKTKKEKRAFLTGLLSGLKRRKKTKTKRNIRVKRYTTSKSKNLKRASRHRMVKRRIGQVSRKNKRKRSLYDDFDYDSRGRIKGSYVDGRFEPD